MAQKKRKEEERKEAEYEFVPPDFDEKDFLEKDIQTTKITMLTTLFAFILGGIAGLINGISPYIGLLLFFAGCYLLQYVYRIIKVDPKKDIDKKGWVGNILLFFFLYLGTWVFLLNPPFN